jgi:hypothetical protein
MADRRRCTKLFFRNAAFIVYRSAHIALYFSRGSGCRATAKEVWIILKTHKEPPYFLTEHRGAMTGTSFAEYLYQSSRTRFQRTR